MAAAGVMPISSCRRISKRPSRRKRAARARRGPAARLRCRARLDRARAFSRAARMARRRRPARRQYQRHHERRAGRDSATTGSFELHLSTRLPGGFWTVELRRSDHVASLPCRDARAGMTLRLPAGARATLLAPYPVRGVESRRDLAAVDGRAALPAPFDVVSRRGTASRSATAT